MLEFLNSGLAHALYQLSSALLLPVMLIVAGLFIGMLVASGGFLREWTERRNIRQGLRKTIRLLPDPATSSVAIWQALAEVSTGLPHCFTAGRRKMPESGIASRASLTELENDVMDRLARLSFVTRVGPMLGLLGTLIPFGPALGGLSSGNVQELSANLITAFATTVVGLLCGCMGFGIGLVRRSWYTRDFDDLEFIVNEIVARNSHESTETTEVGIRG